MGFSKSIIIGAIALFGIITIATVVKKVNHKHVEVFDTKKSKVQEIVIQDIKEKEVVKPEANEKPQIDKKIEIAVKEEKKKEKKVEKKAEKLKEKKQTVENTSTQAPQVITEKQEQKVTTLVANDNLPDADLIDRLFATDSSRLPFVETVVYNSRVPWLKGRPAWIADYAAHYSTTRHFIARSLNKKADYFTQKVVPGDRFNVFKEGKNISFHLLIDINRAKLWFYCLDNDSSERTLLKTYKIGLGRKDSKRVSGCLTPTGKYTLGSKVAIYKPNILGYFQDKKIEMIKVFGTRWVPFEKEVENCSEIAKGFGIHGAPWVVSETGDLVEDRSTIGKYDSDGCIRLFSEDIEEIFSVIISKPTVIELVNDFHDAKLPGQEKQY